MGACFSCSSSSAFNSIRVVHLNGHMEEFEEAVTVRQVTGKPAKHFVCTPTQLLTTGSKPLKDDTLLEPGQVYFLLPYSTLQGDCSPMDLVSLVRRLNTIAKTSRGDQAKSILSPSPRASPLWNNQHGSSPLWSWNSPGRSPNRSVEPQGWNSPSRSPIRFVEPQAGVMAYGQRSSGARSWRPILDTIRERSFNRRSESDLQEKNSETVKVA